jgi:hypothetical protein
MQGFWLYALISSSLLVIVPPTFSERNLNPTSDGHHAAIVLLCQIGSLPGVCHARHVERFGKLRQACRDDALSIASMLTAEIALTAASFDRVVDLFYT